MADQLVHQGKAGDLSRGGGRFSRNDVEIGL